MPSKPTILIIEDHNDLREMFAFGLSVGGYDTLMASDGPEGLELYEANHPDVVLVDVMLPSAVKGLNGYGISARIKASQPDAIVIVMTGRDDLPDLRLLDSHADKILIKPLTVEQVISEVEYIKGKRDVMNPRSMGAPGQTGGSWFSNREMAQYAINLLFIIALSWYVGHIDSKVDQAVHASGLNSVYIQQLREQFAEFKGARQVKE